MNGRNDERMADEGGGRGLIWGTMPEINWTDQKKKSTKSFRQDSRCPCPDFNHEHPTTQVRGVIHSRGHRTESFTNVTCAHHWTPFPTT